MLDYYVVEEIFNIGSLVETTFLELLRPGLQELSLEIADASMFLLGVPGQLIAHEYGNAQS